MSATTTEPIRPDWTIIDGGGPGLATAAALAERLGMLDVAHLAPWSRAIAAAGRELADDASVSWPYRDDEPLVALLRALGRLAVIAPGAAGTTAGALLHAIDAELREQVRVA